MPLSAKGEKILAALKKEYGAEVGEEVFYAGKNKGTFTGVDENDDRADANFRFSDKPAARIELNRSTRIIEKYWAKQQAWSSGNGPKLTASELAEWRAAFGTKQSAQQYLTTCQPIVMEGDSVVSRMDDAGDIIRAAGVLFVCDDKVLFVQRSATGDHAGEWAYPGGKIEDGESALAAAKRECEEEIGRKPKGPMVLHSRRISTGIPSDVAADLAVEPQPAVDFTTFVVKVKEEFVPDLNEEHTAFAWAPINSPPQPMHPDAQLALAKFSMNEYDIAVAVAMGDLTSPQQFMNIWLFDMRITGTGTSYRKKHDEFVYRAPENYLTEQFLRRCAGLPVIIDHPEGDTLDGEEYHERAIGMIVYPYIKGDEVWGIAKIYDEAAAQLMTEKQLSTSPAVVFRSIDGNTSVEIDGAKVLFEGNPGHLDHLAVCRAGVWDKGGAPNGIISTRGDMAVADDDKKRADAAIADGVKSMLDSFRADMQGFGDSLRADMKECMSKMDAHKSRMDAAEEEQKKADAAKADAAKKDSEKSEEEKKADAAKADADEEERKADKAKKDAAAEEEKKADAARADAIKVAVDAAVGPLLKEVSELRARTPANITDDQRAAFADVQARHDVAYLAFGQRAPSPLLNETLGDYRRRLATGLKEHSPNWKDTDLVAMKDDATFDKLEGMILTDALKTARNPIGLPYGKLQPIIRKDDAGREIREYGGDPRSWMDAFGGRPMMVKNINRRGDHLN